MSYHSIASVLTESKTPSQGVPTRQSRAQSDAGKEGSNEKTFSDVMNAEHSKTDRTATSHPDAEKDAAEIPSEASEQPEEITHTEAATTPQETDAPDFHLSLDGSKAAVTPNTSDTLQGLSTTRDVTKAVPAATTIKAETAVQPGTQKAGLPLFIQGETNAQTDAVDAKPSQPVPISAQQASLQSQLAMQKPITGGIEARNTETVPVVKAATPQQIGVEGPSTVVSSNDARTPLTSPKLDDARALPLHQNGAAISKPVQTTTPKVHRPTFEDAPPIQNDVAMTKETRAQTGQISSNFAVQHTPPAPTESAAQANNAALFARAMAPAKNSAELTKTTDTLLTRDTDIAFTVSETRGASSTSATVNAQPINTTHQPAMARHVAAQISDVLRNTSERPVEISLNPAELGRVRMTVLATEGAVTLQVLAERPETLDLMKKNMDLLARELADLGFDSIDLAFGQGKNPTSDDDTAGGNSAKGSNEAAIDPDSVEVMKVAPVMELDASGRLDVRV